MPVLGLASLADQYMLHILVMRIPEGNRIEKCWIETSWDSKGGYIAKASTHFDNSLIEYSAKGNTSKEALLELAATIIVQYPIINGNPSMDIDIPLQDLINTKVFTDWFDSQRG